jgi:hypothetical protein
VRFARKHALAPDLGRLSSRARRSAFAMSLIAAAFVGVTCGGTSGHEGLEQPVAGGTDSSVTADDGGTSFDLDAGAFDVTIDYTTRPLPDAVAPPDAGGGEAGYPWPTCAPFVPVDTSGNPVPIGTEADQVPGVYVDGGDDGGDGGEGGGEVPAPDGSVCATYGWLGSPEIDDCLTSQFNDFQHDFPMLPPCNWCTGTATTGPGAGVPLRTLCFNLYACAMRTGCGALPGPACLCGSANGPACILDAGGPCVMEELAALQANLTSSSVQTALNSYTSLTPQADNNPGYCGSALNFVFHNATALGCFPAADAASP